jgi:hypothetical protein
MQLPAPASVMPTQLLLASVCVRMHTFVFDHQEQIMKRISIPLALVALGTAHVACAAGNEEGRWSASFRVGAELIPHGTFQHGATAQGPAGTVELDSLTYDDIFRVGPSADLELGYRVLSNLEPFVRVSYAQMRGENARIGDVHPAGGTPTVIRANFDDNESWQVDLGTRLFFVDSGPLQSYVAAYVGADRAEELTAHVRVNGVLTPSSRERVLPRETRFAAGLELGVSYEITDAAAISLSVGANFRNARHERSHAFDALGIDTVRVTDQEWTLPIDLGVTWRF